MCNEIKLVEPMANKPWLTINRSFVDLGNRDRNRTGGMKESWQLQLIARIARGEQAAKSELFHKYREPIVWKVSKSIQDNPEAVQDIVGEIWLALLQKLQDTSFDQSRWASLEVLIYGITMNKIRDWFKSKKRNRNRFRRVESLAFIATYLDDYLYEEQEIAEFVRKAISELPNKYKQALEMRYYHELSVQEISVKLDLPPRRVSERIHYATKLLVKACKKHSISAIFGLLMLYINWIMHS